MIHYHGTPCGGKRVDAEEFLRGRHALVPFLRQEDMALVAQVCESFVLDNSAFTAWKSGEPIDDWSEYYGFVDRWKNHPGFDWAIIPDVIDGSEQENDDLLTDWPWSEHGVPVWHFHESLVLSADLSGNSGNISTDSIRSPCRWHLGIPSSAQATSMTWFIRCHHDVVPGSGHSPELPSATVGYAETIRSRRSNATQNGSRKAMQAGCSRGLGMTIIARNIESLQSSAPWTPIAVQEKLFD